MRRFKALLAAVVMAVTMVPVTASAHGGSSVSAWMGACAPYKHSHYFSGTHYDAVIQRAYVQTNAYGEVLYANVHYRWRYATNSWSYMSTNLVVCGSGGAQ